MYQNLRYPKLKAKTPYSSIEQAKLANSYSCLVGGLTSSDITETIYSLSCLRPGDKVLSETEIQQFSDSPETSSGKQPYNLHLTQPQGSDASTPLMRSRPPVMSATILQRGCGTAIRDRDQISTSPTTT